MDKAEHWSYQAGWDSFAPDPGEWKSHTCRACGTEMDVHRDCEGPTSSIMAMAKSKRKYDHFTCPHAGEEWHTQLITLKELANHTPSKAIADLLGKEIEEVLQNRIVTKKGRIYE